MYIFLTNLTELTLFWYYLNCVCFRHVFLSKYPALINLNPENICIKICRNFSYKNLLLKLGLWVYLSDDNEFFQLLNEVFFVNKQPFFWNNNPFCINLTVMQVKISEKSNINFYVLNWPYPRIANGKNLILW